MQLKNCTAYVQMFRTRVGEKDVNSKEYDC